MKPLLEEALGILFLGLVMVVFGILFLVVL